MVTEDKVARDDMTADTTDGESGDTPSFVTNARPAPEAGGLTEGVTPQHQVGIAESPCGTVGPAWG